MAIRKSITQKCKYLQVLPRCHERFPTISLSHPNIALTVPVADALKDLAPLIHLINNKVIF